MFFWNAFALDAKEGLSMRFSALSGAELRVPTTVLMIAKVPPSFRETLTEVGSRVHERFRMIYVFGHG